MGTIAGGSAPNIVPDRCTATLDFRTIPGQDPSALLDRVRAMLEEVGRQRVGIRAEISTRRQGPAIETPADLPFVRLVQAAHREVTGLRQGPEPRGARFFTDGGVLAPAWHCPMVILGPGDPARAHQTDEWVEVAQLTQAATIYATLADQMLGGAA